MYTVLAKTLRMNGQVIGNINDKDIDRVEMHAYVSMVDGRTYTAISKLPPLTGYPMQISVFLGELMGWLFASGSASNGFILTGSCLLHLYHT